jgi:CHAT domain-containing protein
MPGKVGSLLLAFLLFVFFDFSKPDSPEQEILSLYKKADKLFNLPNSSDLTDSLAKSTFQQVVKRLENQTVYRNDTLLFLSFLKIGILMDVQLNYEKARENYLSAISIYKPGSTINDSFFFRTCVYLGTSYYNLNNFDSANYFLLKAESFPNHFPVPIDRARLYNALGALYYDNGNYYQSKNYFGKGLEIIEDNQPFDTLSKASISTNIATSFYRLGQYHEALALYRKILGYHVFSNYIYMNMGRANTALNKYQEALSCFRKVNPNEVPGVFNEIAFTQIQIAKPDSAAWFLNRFQSFVRKDGTKINILDMGINQSYRAELFVQQHLYSAALKTLQQAILIFSGNFKNQDIFVNPANFTGSFAYYKLFDALFEKAIIFGMLYDQNGKEENLRASFDAYESTLTLLGYIEKNFDTDDAKILLKKKSREVYQKALLASLELYRLHPKDHYLEKAFLISERNKGSIMAASLKERSFNSFGDGKEAKLMEQERNIKYNIARLNVKTDQSQDSKTLESLAREKSDYEIELSQLQKEFEKNNAFYKLKYEDSYPDVKELQDHLTNDQALISFYTTAKALHVFIVTKKDFVYTQIDSLALLEKNIEDWLNLLRFTESGRKFKGEITGSRLYNLLIQPIQSAMPEKKEWIIIPDGILYYLPFESLPANSQDNSILETTAVSYQFSSRFILAGQASASSSAEYRVLAFAPFAGKDIGQDSSVLNNLKQLPASADEIAGLQGAIYLDSSATKAQFLKQINKFPIVHLATHAFADMSNPAASYVAFYPQKKSAVEDYLFLEELYGLNMDATKLVIISACETGKGELVNNEGVISLARAFTYAGCGSTVNSLWKADDRSTSAILKQFHIYLQHGYGKSKALQQAKLDFIKSNAIYKSPDYWSNLILIGNIDPICQTQRPSIWKVLILSSTLVLLSSLFLIQLRRRKLKEKSTVSRTMDFK